MKRLAALALAATAFFATCAHAQTSECGGEYQIRGGDTLAGITRAHYGPGVPIQLIYSANTAVLRGRLSRLPVGAFLQIPCLGGRAPTSVGASPETARPDDQMRTLRIAASADWAPLMDADAPAGGILPQIVSAALSAAGGAPFEIIFSARRDEQLGLLAKDGDIDIAVGWAPEDCAARSGGCDGLAWSDPLFEVTSSVFVSPYAQDAGAEDFAGRPVCAARGVSEQSLKSLGLDGPDARIIWAGSLRTCARMVATDKAFAAAAPRWLMETAIADAKLGASLKRNPHLEARQLVYAVISSADPDRTAILDRLNEGLAVIRDSGEWFGIVQLHLQRDRSAELFGAALTGTRISG